MAAVPNIAEAKRGANFYDVEAIRRDFPILSRSVHGVPLVYLDSAASAQKPRAVIDATSRFYENDYANIHRGVYYLSEVATEAYEGARGKIGRFIGAGDPREIIFTRGATEAINLVAQSFGQLMVPGDEVIITELEHHSNIVPWQMLRDGRGISLKVAPVTDEGILDLAMLERLISPRTRLIAITHMSNAFGVIMPIERVIALAKAAGVAVLIDGCQAVPHMPVDVTALDCDFYTFSGHKLYGPSGIGVLYGKARWLEAMPPYQGGGDMIASVTFEKTEYARIPAKFEAGTPNIAGAIGLAAAVDYVAGIGVKRIQGHEQSLIDHARRALEGIEGLRVVGAGAERGAIVSFTLDCAHPHDIGTVLDRAGVAIRAGHHCAQPAMERFGVGATARASFGLYTTKEEINALARALQDVRGIFG